MGQALHLVARNRGVGRDDAVDAVDLERLRDHADLGFLQVGRDLDEHRHAPAGLALQLQLALLKPRQQGVQRLVALQRPQVLGVGAGDVDGDVVGVGEHALKPDQVVVHRVLDRRGGVLADVQAEDAAGRAEAVGALHVGDEAVQALVVEAQPVDQGLGFGQAEHARLVVAGLALGGDRAHLDEAKAHRAQAVDAAAVLVQAGRQAHAVRETQAGDGHRIADPLAAPQALQRGVLQLRDAVERQFMGALGIEAKQEGAGKGVGNH
mmetsp:Transcript_21394/g.82924  ORF Transcript_21394/g.82924 Transcript_21394/m.82924 type:complete len:265 (+) Transcript_21394:6278-7072(+)